MRCECIERDGRVVGLCGAHGQVVLAIEARHEPIRKALAFYAEPKNWQSPSTGFAAQYDPEPSPVKAAGNWKRAAEALEKQNG